MVIGAAAFAFAYFDAGVRAAPDRLDAVLRRVPDPDRRSGSATARSASLAHLMTRRRPPDWVSAKPKRFAWSLGLGLSFVDDDHHEQRDPRLAAALDLPRLPDADVDGVGARPVPRLQAPRPAACAAAGRRRTPRSRSAPAAPARSPRQPRRSSTPRSRRRTERRYAAASCSSTASTSSSCVFGVTLGITCATTPSGPMTKVARRAPKYFLPYIDFSAHTP